MQWFSSVLTLNQDISMVKAMMHQGLQFIYELGYVMT